MGAGTTPANRHPTRAGTTSMENVYASSTRSPGRFHDAVKAGDSLRLPMEFPTGQYAGDATLRVRELKHFGGGRFRNQGEESIAEVAAALTLHLSACH